MMDITSLSSVLKEKYRMRGQWSAMVDNFFELEHVWRSIRRHDPFVYFDVPDGPKGKTRMAQSERRAHIEKQVGHSPAWSIEYENDGFRVALSFQLWAVKEDRKGGMSTLMYSNRPMWAMIGSGSKAPKIEEEPVTGWLEISKYDNAKRLADTSWRYTNVRKAEVAIDEAWLWWRTRWGEIP